MPRPQYPVTARGETVDVQFGTPVADPYRWLEADVRNAPDVAQWVESQNAVTRAFLNGIPGRETFKERMLTLTNFARTGLPRKAGSRYFHTANTGLQNQSPLYVRDSITSEPRLLIDPNGFAADGATAIAEWEPSPDGRYLLYAVQDGGTDWRILRVIDVATGKLLDDRIEWVKFSNLAWDGNGEGFFYSRFDAPADGTKFQSTNLNQKVLYHKIGTAQSEDVLIYATPRKPKLGHSAQVTDDGRWLIITSAEGTDDRYELTLVPLTGKSRTPRTLVRGFDYDWSYVGGTGDTLYFRTNRNAPRGRLVTLNARRPKTPLVEIVPQRAETLGGASMIGSRIVLAYMKDARSMAILVDLNGKRVSDVPMPGLGTAAGFSGKAGDPETFFSFSDFARPATIYRYDTSTGKAEPFAVPKLAFNPDDYVSEQIFFASKDGTRVPMFVVRRRDLATAKTPAPTLMYGYGGFNIPLTPSFKPATMAWLEQGGVLAVVNLRGGGEWGSVA